MPANKRQHYVPQNYLRSFSADGSSIGVFQIDTEKCIDTAPIKSQAQEAYFYSDMLVLEKKLGDLEQIMADNRKTIFNDSNQKLTLYQKEILYQDMMLQLFRTRQMADVYEEIATAKARRAWSHSNDEFIRKNADNFGIKYNYPVMPSMLALLNNLGICLDLEFKVLVNRTCIPFVTSDNPVSRYNQYFEAWRKKHCGLNSAGLQLFYPLSPEFGVIYYDHNVYSTKYRKRNFLEIADESDVNNLNGLTCASANHCVYYYAGYMPGEFVKWTFEHVKDARGKLVNITEVPETSSSSFVMYQFPFPAFHMCLSFMKFQDKVKPYKVS